jgi:hypothetical protein
MAFCNSCGATLSDGTNFCPKCGASTAGGPPAPRVAATGATTSVPPTPTGGGSALKVILIVAGVIIALGVAAICTVAIIGIHMARNSHVSQQGDQVKVETPLGTFSANDPDQATRELGVDLYPGAQVQKNGAATATFGSVHTVAATFETSDSVDQVCDFYKSKFPNASVNSSDRDRCTIVSNDHKNVITINVQGDGGTTKLQITNVNKKAASSD